MSRSRLFVGVVTFSLAASIVTPGLRAPAARAQNALGTNAPATQGQTILDAQIDLKRIAPSSAQVSVARDATSAATTSAATTSALDIAIAPGQDAYPGIDISPPTAAWDFSRFGHLEAKVKNTGTKPISVSLRVDNAGDWHDNPWNAESLGLEPGASGTLKVVFGFSYGQKPGYALKSEAVTKLKFFTSKSDEAQSFRIESLIATGIEGEKPPVDPATIRVQPKEGMLFRASDFADGLTTVTLTPGVKTSMTLLGQEAPLKVEFPASTGEQSLSIQPAKGRWDLRPYTQVRVRLRNIGTTPISPRAQLKSNGGASDWISTSAPIAPKSEATITIPFAGSIADMNVKGTGSQLTSDAVSVVSIALNGEDKERTMSIETIQAGFVAPVLPGWLGKRPPIEGDWVQTLDDEFNGAKLDDSIWSIQGDNYWDKASHWSRNNVLLKDGQVKLRYEKKSGWNNDDPNSKTQTDYASGYLHTYDKWVQRYGYFEARMKLPKAPGLWPAFWMMPDRGIEVGPEQWKRQDTGNGAMEFDIMEQLTRWGGNRYNIAMHYDGYGADHKNLGSDKIYLAPDKDGFITCGLLWTPGEAVYYAQGREVLRWKDARISNVPSILMFTLPQGGWDNDAVDPARLPADFTIDYVRVWQRRDLASSADGKKPGATK